MMFMSKEKVENIARRIWDESFKVVKGMFDQRDEDIESLQGQLTTLKETVDELNHLRDRKHSDEPWFEFVGGEVHPEHGLELRLDWNDAFIDQLKHQGYKGTSDDEIIAQYIANVQKSVEGRK